jgi:hypothetical protein
MVRLNIYIKGEGTSTKDYEPREGFLDVLHAIKREGHLITHQREGADIIIDHLALGAPVIEDGEDKGMLDWAVARVILENIGVIPNAPKVKLKIKEQPKVVKPAKKAASKKPKK